MLGDSTIKVLVKFAIKASRAQAKDKAEFDRVVNEHEVFQEFCQSLGIKTKK